MTAPLTVLIIGGGFSGTAVAANLLRGARPLRVVLLNRFGPIGRGVAYGTRLESHVLNVPAGQMALFPDEPDGFLRFAQERDPSIGAGTFVARQLYGEYLARELSRAEAASGSGSSLERLIGEARSLETRAGNGAPLVRLANGDTLEADHVVLALGNYSPDNPPLEDPSFYESARYVRDPWIRGSLDAVGPEDAVLLVGTGLTMMDIALDLRTRGCLGPFHAVSRRGLVPHAHREGGATGLTASLPSEFGGARTTRAYLRLLRRTAAAHEAAGGDWRAVVGAIRMSTPELWRRLDRPERARFLRHVRPWWDIHRHRAAPRTAQAVREMISADELRVLGGRVVSLEEEEDGVRVRIRLRGGSTIGDLRVDRVVNCTGPSTDARRLADPLIASLRQAGLIRPDPLGLGIDADEQGAILDAAGRPSDRLWLIGPLLKARDWEATAVPELRRLAAEVARQLLDRPRNS